MNVETEARAVIFAALGDETRLMVLERLSSGAPQSLVKLTSGTRLTRQAVSRHLKVLENAGLVRATRVGRESLYDLQLSPVKEAQQYLDRVARQWDQALERLRSFVEDGATE